MLSGRCPPCREVGLFVFLAQLAGCGERGPHREVEVRDSAGVTIVENHVPMWGDRTPWVVEPEAILSIGTPDGPAEDQLFGVRGATRLPDGSVVVNNSGTVEIRIYGPDGRHLRTLGGEGGGPGEFRWIAWMQHVPPDTPLVQEGSTNRLTRFTLDGRTGMVNMAVKFGRQGLRAVQGAAVALGDGSDYDIRLRRADGALLRIRRAVSRRPVSDADVRRWIEARLEQMPEARRPLMRRRMDEAPTATLMPSYSALQIDRLGNLWVEAFRAPGDEAPRVWSVFDTGGRWLGDVVFPEGLEVYEIGDDYVLGKEGLRFSK